MKENRAAWLELTKRLEGGYCNLDGDRGGPTHFGVTQATLAAWRRQPVTEADVKALEWPECAELLAARYWNVVQGDKLPPGLDLAVADMAVHSGTQRAAVTLQKLLGCRPDGHVGPQTLEACRAAEMPGTILRFGEARLAFLRGLAGWAPFGRGWAARLDAVQTTALRLAREQAEDKPQPIPATKRAINTQAVVAAAGAVIASLPAARDAYQQAATATAPLAELAAWVPAALGLAVALGTLLLLARRGLKLADQQ